MSAVLTVYRLRSPGSWMRLALMAAILSALPWALTTLTSDAGSPVTRTPSQALSALWGTTVIVSYVIGGGVWRSLLPVLGTPVAWARPAAYTRLLRGASCLGLTIAAALALVHWRVGGSGSAIVAWSVALFAYESWMIGPWLAERYPRVGGAVSRQMPGAMLAVIILACVAGDDLIGRPSLAHLGVASGSALLVAAGLLIVGLRDVSTTARMQRVASSWSRMLHGARTSVGATSASNDASRATHARGPLSGPDAHGVAWLHTLWFERIGNRSTAASVWRVLREAARSALLVVLFMTIMPAIAVVLATADAWVGLQHGALPLRSGVLHPISRRERAELAFRARALSVLVRLALLWVFVASLYALWKHFVSIEPSSLGATLVPPANATPLTLVLAVAVASGVSALSRCGGASVRHALSGLGRRERGPGDGYQSVGGGLVSTAAALAFAHWSQPHRLAGEAAGVAAFVVAAHWVYWLALQRASRTVDLV